ncbi:hypothetical protein SEA_DOGGS_61 [Gordonia phage Doggs]|nr:hypothetical protein SEA_DOGGS_61 [Gordonia phage Doggs]
MIQRSWSGASARLSRYGITNRVGLTVERSAATTRVGPTSDTGDSHSRWPTSGDVGCSLGASGAAAGHERAIVLTRGSATGSTGLRCTPTVSAPTMPCIEAATRLPAHTARASATTQDSRTGTTGGARSVADSERGGRCPLIGSVNSQRFPSVGAWTVVRDAGATPEVRSGVQGQGHAWKVLPDASACAGCI